MTALKKGDWTPLPPDMTFLVGFYLIILPLALLFSLVIPALSDFRQHGVAVLLMPAVASGIVGTVLLFFARLPLYRQRQFFSFGPRHLDRAHRRLYWLAYLIVGASVVLLLILLAGVQR
jgi:hypothetical protein